MVDRNAISVLLVICEKVYCKNKHIYRPQQWLRKGNVFTSICHSVQEGVCMTGGVHGRRACMVGGLHGGGYA